MASSRQATTDIDKPIVIQDIVIAGQSNPNPPPHNPTGEFGMPDKFGGYKGIPQYENPDYLIDRLYKQIEAFVPQAAQQHYKACFQPGTNQFKQGKEDQITRLMTNEFFFYTKQPLTIAQFEKLMQRVEAMAKMNLPNLHLILGSFAVRTPDNKIMNVVPQIECGPSPQINLVVKNNPSAIDPVYRERDAYKRIIELPNVDIKRGDRVDGLGIQLGGQFRSFSFNNVFKCRTAGGTPYHSCIDICLDHGMGVAKKNLDTVLEAQLDLAKKGVLMDKIPTQCAHAVLSNWIPINPVNTVGGITHADPVCSHEECKAGVPTSYKYGMQLSSFGTPGTVLITPPASCAKLASHELCIANYHNELHKFMSAYRGDYSSMPAKMTSAYRTMEMQFQYSKSNDVLMKCVATNNIAMLHTLFSQGASPNARVPDSGDTLLSLAVRFKLNDMAKFLLSRGANPITQNKEGKMPIHYAQDRDIFYTLDQTAKQIAQSPPRPTSPIPAMSSHLLSTRPTEVPMMTPTHLPRSSPIAIKPSAIAYEAVAARPTLVKPPPKPVSATPPPIPKPFVPPKPIAVAPPTIHPKPIAKSPVLPPPPAPIKPNLAAMNGERKKLSSSTKIMGIVGKPSPIQPKHDVSPSVKPSEIKRSQDATRPKLRDIKAKKEAHAEKNPDDHQPRRPRR